MAELDHERYCSIHTFKSIPNSMLRIYAKSFLIKKYSIMPFVDVHSFANNSNKFPFVVMCENPSAEMGLDYIDIHSTCALYGVDYVI